MGAKTPWFTVVGVVADVRHWGIGRPPQAESFLSYLQDPPTDMTVTIRTSGDPRAVAAGGRAAVLAVDRSQPVARVETMGAIVDESLATARVSASLAGLFGALALGLALLGIYGVMASAVTGRTREIGIRMALGKPPPGVLALVLRQALALVAAGILLGIAGALALTRLLAGALYQVRPADPATFALVAAAVLGVGVAAAWLPARKAARLDAAVALRNE